MIYAENNENNKIRAEKGFKAMCPLCKEKVIPKCGEINIWHWAHKKEGDCDKWSEGETEWHLWWKSQVDKENTEVRIDNHRADIKNNKGVVIELQNSPISCKEMIERENFYGNMIWLFNVQMALNRFNPYTKEKNGKRYEAFRWKQAKKGLDRISKPIFLDFGKFIFELKKIYYNGRCYGWGHVLEYEDFMSEYVYT